MKLIPLLVMQENSVVHACLAHEKSAEKTLETKVLWEVHPTTHRVVPVEPRVSVERVCRRASWYVAYTDQDKDTQVSSYQMAEKIECSPKELSEETNTSEDNEVLFFNNLYDLVSQRNTMRPEGSYTTHLFESGAQKIRKKLGEEVVEVILAQSQGELVSEISDLLYHLIVLLVDSNISLKSCIEVLQKRYVK